MKRFNQLLSLSLLLTAVGTACGGDVEIAETDLAGKIAGNSWAMSSAVTDAFLSDESSYSVTFYGANIERTCTGAEPESTSPTVLASIPKTPGSYELKFDLFDLSGSRTVTVVPSPGQNIVLTEGLIEVEKVEGNVIHAGLFATDGSGNHEISGRFQATICESRF